MWREPLEPVIPWVKCWNCGHVFTAGYFTDEALNVLFGNTVDQQVVGVDIEHHRNISAKMVERVVYELGLPGGRLWLDVGFGNGSLLMTAMEFGFSAFGIDLRKQNAEALVQYGIRGYHGTLQSAINDGVFTTKPSVISMADVVEHEPYPVETLYNARELIAEPGILLISMPNADAPLWHHWNATSENPYSIEIEHYHNFTRERLYSLLNQNGFRPLHYSISERYRCCMEILAEPA
jgi:2-polyprenyl-3-methyl-5-hydroxy-6-metoxy-1,4-benzoquinol methylase